MARSGRKILRHLAIPAIAVGAVIAALPHGGGDPAARQRWTPMTPVAVTYGTDLPAEKAAPGNLLGFNDFHGANDPPTGGGAAVNGTPAGGVEYLATWLDRLRDDASGIAAFVCAIITAITLSAVYGTSPVTHSKATQPSA